MFLADALGLDFLNSVATPAVAEIDWLANGEDLLAWLEAAKLVPADVAGALRAKSFPGELDAVAVQARALREWFRGFVHAHKGRPLQAAVLEKLAALNQILARDEAYRVIVRSPGRDHGQEMQEDAQAPPALELHALRRWRTPETLLLPIAEAMADLVCSADFTQVKQCEGPGCTLVFLDKTKGHARRWCSMAVCGNRAKQAAHRARTKTKR